MIEELLLPYPRHHMRQATLNGVTGGLTTRGIITARQKRLVFTTTVDPGTLPTVASSSNGILPLS